MLRLIDREESEAGVLFQRCSKDVQKDERIILAVKEKMGGELFGRFVTKQRFWGNQAKFLKMSVQIN